MIIVNDMRQALGILGEDWELLEVSDLRQENNKKVFQELWINSWTQEQEIIERRIDSERYKT